MANPNQRPIAEQIQEATERAMFKMNMHLDQRFTEEISAVKWAYNTPPEVRDIVDTGRLRASQLRIVKSPTETIFDWPVEYSMPVHEGGTDNQGRPFLARRWTEKPLQEAAGVFANAFAAEIAQL